MRHRVRNSVKQTAKGGNFLQLIASDAGKTIVGILSWDSCHSLGFIYSLPVVQTRGAYGQGGELCVGISWS